MSQVRSARELGADVAHFPEACLSGYAGTDFTSYRGFDWTRLEAATRRVLEVARHTRLWVILGSTHRLTGRHKPHDCVYVINNRGMLVDRYDKMFCSGDGNGRIGDLAHYSPGNHFTVFRLKGIRCGVLICYEYAFPELYREYKRRGVQLVFHSFHAGHASRKTVRLMAREVGIRFHKLNAGSSYPEIRMPASVQAAATANHLWVSCSNTSAQLFLELFCARGWHHHGSAEAKRRWCAGVNGGHERTALRRHFSLAESGDAWDLAQRHARARQAVGHSNPIVTRHHQRLQPSVVEEAAEEGHSSTEVSAGRLLQYSIGLKGRRTRHQSVCEHPNNDRRLR